jgi:hypothetical protein
MKKILNSLSRSSFLQRDFSLAIYVLLSVLVPIITFSDLDPVYAPGVDPPMAWVFNYFFDGHLSEGKNIIFPHGPLAFLMYPLPEGNNLATAVLFHFLLKIIFSFLLFRLVNHREKSNHLAPFLVAIFFCGIFDIQFLLLGITALCLVLHFLTEKKSYLVPAILFCSLSVYIRAFGGIATIALCGSYFLLQFAGSRSWKRLLVCSGSLLLGIVLIWILLYHTLSGFPRYLFGLFQLSQDNSSAVAMYPENNWLFISIAFFILCLIPFISKSKSALLVYGMFLLPLFAAWKYAMAREDIFHASSLFVLLLFFYAIVYFVAERRRFLILFLGLLSAGFYYGNLENVDDFRDPGISKNGLNAFRTFISDYDTLSKKYKALSLENIRTNKLDEKSLSLIQNKTVDIYPWDYTFIPANNLNWRPRPVIQSYASYTSWLDLQNKEHFESASAPEFLLWETDKVTEDQNGGNFESIDERYLLNDEPQTVLALLNKYSFVHKHPRYLLFQKNTGDKLEQAATKSSGKIKWNEWTDVPYAGDGILRAKIRMKQKAGGKIKSFFYKSEAFYIVYKLENKDVFRYRIVPKNAADGIWINPFLQKGETDFIESPVRQIQIRCTDVSQMQEEAEIEWQYSRLKTNPQTSPGPKGPYDGACALFGKTVPSSDSLLFITENKFSQRLEAWTYNEQQIYDKEYSTSPKSMQLKPGEYSMTYARTFDSAAFKSGKELQIKSTVTVKATRSAEVKLVISLEDERGNPISWTGTRVSPFIIDEDNWNFCSAVAKVSNQQLKGKLTLKVFLWNVGKEQILADDFSVRAEMTR